MTFFPSISSTFFSQRVSWYAVMPGSVAAAPASSPPHLLHVNQSEVSTGISPLIHQSELTCTPQSGARTSPCR